MSGTRRRLAIVLSVSVMMLAAGAASATSIGPGTLPSWADEATWTDLQSTYSAASYLATITNSVPTDGVNIWFCFVYDRDPYQAGGARYTTDINWGDTSSSYSNYTTHEEWFTSAQVPTGYSYYGQYGRVTTSVDLAGDLDWESIAFATAGNSGNITELYVYVNQNPVPEPATMLMLGCLGAGMAVARKVRHRKTD